MPAMTGQPLRKGKIRKFEFRLIQVLTIFLFLGRAWQCFFFDTPIRGLLFDEYLLKGFVENWIGISWKDYAQLYANRCVLYSESVFAVLLLFSSLGAIFIKSWRIGSSQFVRIGAGLLIVLALLHYKEQAYALGKLFEYSIQCALPFILVYLSRGDNLNTNRFRAILATLIATTFFCHGLYACGYYPQPHVWIEWCMSIFNLVGIDDEEKTRILLCIVGGGDFVVAFLLLLIWIESKVQGKKLKSLYQGFIWGAIWYCTIWGTLTALARITANFYFDTPVESLSQWWFQTSYRLGHGGLPLFLLWIWSRHQKTRF